MDIETLKRMQETEKTLRIHNITAAPQEAIDSARKDVYVGGTKVPDFNNITSQPVNTKKLIKEATGGITMDDQKEAEMKKTIEEQGELITKQAKLIYELQGAVNEIIKEIKKMQSSVPTKNPGQRQQVLKAEEKQEHPRSGGYTSNDVAIDKFFYSGTK